MRVVGRAARASWPPGAAWRRTLGANPAEPRRSPHVRGGTQAVKRLLAARTGAAAVAELITPTPAPAPCTRRAVRAAAGRVPGRPAEAREPHRAAAIALLSPACVAPTPLSGHTPSSLPGNRCNCNSGAWARPHDARSQGGALRQCTACPDESAAAGRPQVLLVPASSPPSRWIAAAQVCQPPSYRPGARRPAPPHAGTPEDRHPTGEGADRLFWRCAPTRRSPALRAGRSPTSQAPTSLPLPWACRCPPPT